jgi:uncharacterized SAM-binding protein YcdF (DUF218 family)
MTNSSQGVQASEPSLWTRRALHHALGLAAVGLVGCGALARVYDVHLVEKLLTRLAMPCGLLWATLLLLAYTSWFLRRRGLAAALLVVALAYWLAGSTITSQWLIGLLENRYPHVDPATLEPFDVVVVLGGGTATNSAGDVWLSLAGDRLNLGATLFLQGKTRTLVTTGTHYEWLQPRQGGLASGTALLWQRLGIPADKIVTIEGHNTSEEIRNLRSWFGDRPPARVGLVTSAFHMPRAQRLARAQGLEFTPLPADFRVRVPEPLPLAMIPNNLGFFESDIVAKEFLAALVSR